ncbi:MAG TPA: Flp family type IVb pilin [Caulobacterales bacterium]|jgi:pilus assembly protein Flp/PilA|nr:Flp family type IVb pilin [Caulobacterales bacterium]
MKFLASRSGATAIEYGLIATFICIVIVGAIGAVGTQLGVLFDSVVAGFPPS